MNRLHEHHNDPIVLANSAFETAMDVNLDAARPLLERIVFLGPFSLDRVFRQWVERSSIRAGIVPSPHTSTVLESDDTGEQRTTDELSAAMQWATRMFDAHATCNNGGWTRLIKAMPWTANPTVAYRLAEALLSLATVTAADGDERGAGHCPCTSTPCPRNHYGPRRADALRARAHLN
jgi:hypothetical protein